MLKGIGKTVITVVAKEDKNYKAAQIKITLTVNPRKPDIYYIDPKSSGKARVYWNISEKSGGYQIRYSLKKNMKGAKIRKISGGNKDRVLLKGLKKGKTYYVQARAYKKADGKTYYSGWSGKKSVKIKKK